MSTKVVAYSLQSLTDLFLIIFQIKKALHGVRVETTPAGQKEHLQDIGITSVPLAQLRCPICHISSLDAYSV